MDEFGEAMRLACSRERILRCFFSMSCAEAFESFSRGQGFVIV